MTHGDINQFLTSISEAKRAFDAEPGYLSRIDDLDRRCHSLGETIAQRELRIHELKQAEDSLIAKLRSVEAERDDAGFRALEEADKTSQLLSAMHVFLGEACRTVSAVQGREVAVVPKETIDGLGDEVRQVKKQNDDLIFSLAEKDAELQRLQGDIRMAQEQFQRPLSFGEATTSATSSSVADGTDHSSPRHDMFPEPEYYEKAKGQSEVDPTASNPVTHITESETVNVSGAGSTPSVTTTASVEGQSDGPFASQAEAHSESVSASSTSAESETSVASSASPPERNRDRSTFFTGRKYFDVTYFVPLHQWLNEGGTRDDYYWRPADANVALPEPSRASHKS